MAVLPQSFYRQSTLKIAQNLLGCFLVCKKNNQEKRLMIVETEAYKGFSDAASHASRGKTKRNAVMFGPPGYLYVYLVYGIHYMLNIVTEKEGYPAAVLLRAGEVEGLADERVASGPGKLTKFLVISRSDNGKPVFNQTSDLYVEKGKRPANSDIIKTTRVGVDYAGQCKHRKWRYYINNSSAVSKK